jgi:hypothetical protein
VWKEAHAVKWIPVMKWQTAHPVDVLRTNPDKFCTQLGNGKIRHHLNSYEKESKKKERGGPFAPECPDPLGRGAG